jgi:hypothetical protein
MRHPSHSVGDRVSATALRQGASDLSKTRRGKDSRLARSVALKFLLAGPPIRTMGGARG